MFYIVWIWVGWMNGSQTYYMIRRVVTVMWPTGYPLPWPHGIVSVQRMRTPSSQSVFQIRWIRTYFSVGLLFFTHNIFDCGRSERHLFDIFVMPRPIWPFPVMWLVGQETDTPTELMQHQLNVRELKRSFLEMRCDPSGVNEWDVRLSSSPRLCPRPDEPSSIKPLVCPQEVRRVRFEWY